MYRSIRKGLGQAIGKETAFKSGRPRMRQGRWIPVTYVSTWDGGITVESEAAYHPESGRVRIKPPCGCLRVEGLENLESQYITLPDGNNLDVHEDEDNNYTTRLEESS